MRLDGTPRELIDASNILDRLVEYPTTVTNEEEFVAYHADNPDFYVLVPANPEYFEFDDEDVFTIAPETILRAIYNHDKSDYKGFTDAFKTFSFLKKFKVRDKYADIVKRISAFNQETVDLVSRLMRTHSSVGAFQTRNIPHLGHERIMQLMLEHADHLVLNPVIGPKISTDLKIEEYTDQLKPYFDKKYGGRVSIRPVIANMYYAGPREAIHHAKLRQRLGFTHFTVGRDHAGSEGCYAPGEAPKLAAAHAGSFGIKIISHNGAAYCHGCGDVVIVGNCQHSHQDLEEISGSMFREKLREGQTYKFADTELQRHLGEIK